MQEKNKFFLLHISRLNRIFAPYFIDLKYQAGDNLMAWKKKYRCSACGCEAEAYEGRGLFRQEIHAVTCPDCKRIGNITVGGIIGDVAPSFRSDVGRLCPHCGSDDIRLWDKHTCPHCHGTMKETGEQEFWT